MLENVKSSARTPLASASAQPRDAGKAMSSSASTDKHQNTRYTTASAEEGVIFPSCVPSKPSAPKAIGVEVHIS